MEDVDESWTKIFSKTLDQDQKEPKSNLGNEKQVRKSALSRAQTLYLEMQKNDSPTKTLFQF